MSKTFDTTPDPAFLRAMQNQKWTMAGALSELIDNSFGSGRGNGSRVRIQYKPESQSLTVLDNGQGMEAIGRLFQLGNTIGRGPGDIGQYGAGGTMAILWLATKVMVVTMRDGMISRDTVDWERQIRVKAYPSVSNDWIKATTANTPHDLFEQGHGTLIHITLAKERRGFHVANVRRDIGATYAPALRQGKVVTWETFGHSRGRTQEGEVTLGDSFPELTNVVNIHLMFATPDDDELTVTGQVGIVHDLAQSKSSVSVGFGPRVIQRTRDCYSSKNEVYGGTGVTGWLDLSDGWQPFLATTKDTVNDKPVWDLLMSLVFEKIQPLLIKTEMAKEDLVFSGLEFDLQQVLDSKVNDYLLDRAKETVEGFPDLPGTRGDGVNGTKAKPTEAEGEDAKAEEPTGTRVIVERTTDEVMEGMLCRTQANARTIFVYVNKDHPIMVEALKAKPINRMALHLLMTRDIAEQIVSQPEMLRAVFPPKVWRQLEDQDDQVNQSRMVQRVLVDRLVTTMVV